MLTSMNRNVYGQISSAYRAMVIEANYRPAAPSDVLGNITVPEEELNLEKEAADYANRWWNEEESLSFYIGSCDFQTRKATIFAVEAARLMCSGTIGHPFALRLLKLAVKEVEQYEKRTLSTSA
jgi:hypothetical protein